MIPLGYGTSDDRAQIFNSLLTFTTMGASLVPVVDETTASISSGLNGASSVISSVAQGNYMDAVLEAGMTSVNIAAMNGAEIDLDSISMALTAAEFMNVNMGMISDIPNTIFNKFNGGKRFSFLGDSVPSGYLSPMFPYEVGDIFNKTQMIGSAFGSFIVDAASTTPTPQYTDFAEVKDSIARKVKESDTVNDLPPLKKRKYADNPKLHITVDEPLQITVPVDKDEEQGEILSAVNQVDFPVNESCVILKCHHPNYGNKIIILPFTPSDGFSDRYSPQWDDTPLRGTTQPYQFFNSMQARELSFSVPLHEDMELILYGATNTDLVKPIPLHGFIESVRSILIPEYNKDNVVIPEVSLLFGNFEVSGHCTTLDVEYSLPYSYENHFYKHATLEVVFTVVASKVATSSSELWSLGKSIIGGETKLLRTSGEPIDINREIIKR